MSTQPRDNPRLTLDLHDYRASVARLRAAVGIGGRKPAYSYVEIELAKGRLLRMRTENLYVQDVRIDTKSDEWIPLADESYTGMEKHFNEPKSLTRAEIETALRCGQLQRGFPCAVACLVTAEAARFQTVYRILQQILQNQRTCTWQMVKPLFAGPWDNYTKKNHKRRPLAYGALRWNDY